MLRRVIVIAVLVLLPVIHAQQKSTTMTAKGTFTVEMKPPASGPAEGLARFSMEKKIHGDIEGTSTGEMISGGDPRQGEAGYVAMEVVTGTIHGKKGSFALQHSATMDKSGQKLSIVVVPGSGTGDFKGIAGTFEIVIADGGHSYKFEYTLP